MAALQASLAGIGFGPHNALALMVFCLLYVPCTATIATIQREVGSKRMTALMIGFQLLVAWGMSFLIYHISMVFR